MQCLFCLHSLFLSKRYPHIYFLFIHPCTAIAPCAFLPDSTSMQQIIVPYTPRLDLNREREQVGTNKHSWFIFRPPSKQDLKRSGDSAWGSLSAGLNSSLLGHKAGWQCHALLFAFNVIFAQFQMILKRIWPWACFYVPSVIHSATHWSTFELCPKNV